MFQFDHMTELNDSDHINKLVDMSQFDHMTVQNENSENEMLFMNNKFLLLQIQHCHDFQLV